MLMPSPWVSWEADETVLLCGGHIEHSRLPDKNQTPRTPPKLLGPGWGRYVLVHSDSRFGPKFHKRSSGAVYLIALVVFGIPGTQDWNGLFIS